MTLTHVESLLEIISSVEAEAPIREQAGSENAREALAFPPPTFIAPTSMHYIPEAGPSFVGTVDSPSPPSTTKHCDSHLFSVEDGFCLHKLGGLATAVSATTSFSTSSAPISLDYKAT
jgi:hypothetical protein